MSRKAKRRTKEEYFTKEKEIIGTSTVDFDGPVITGGKGVVGYDLDGKKFLDFTGQISLLNTGYGPKEVISAICQQAKSGVHSCIPADYPYLNEITINRRKLEISRVVLAEKLIELTDKVMPFRKRIFFEATGATGINEAGYIAEIAYRRNHGVKTEDLQPYFESDIFIPANFSLFKSSYLAFKGAFHGRHGLAKLLTNSKPKQMWGVHSSYAVGRLPFPGPFFAYDDYKPYWVKVDRIIEELSKFAPVVAFVFEPIQGEGGINIPDRDFMRGLISHLKSKIKELYLIADEVQTGLGRTGKMFACEYFGIQPDIMVLSKSLGAGIPTAAVIVNDGKFKDLEPGMHSGSHHATPLACAAAIVNIEKIERENLVEQSANHGTYALRRLREIAKRYPEIMDVRGSGLMIGIEFSSTQFRDAVVKRCFKNGLLLAACGKKVIRMTPALIVSIKEIDEALDIFENVLRVN